jgi:hypothetical protein
MHAILTEVETYESTQPFTWTSDAALTIDSLSGHEYWIRLVPFLLSELLLFLLPRLATH